MRKINIDFSRIAGAKCAPCAYSQSLYYLIIINVNYNSFNIVFFHFWFHTEFTILWSCWFQLRAQSIVSIHSIWKTFDIKEASWHFFNVTEMHCSMFSSFVSDMNIYVLFQLWAATMVCPTHHNLTRRKYTIHSFKKGHGRTGLFLHASILPVVFSMVSVTSNRRKPWRRKRLSLKKLFTSNEHDVWIGVMGRGNFHSIIAMTCMPYQSNSLWFIDFIRNERWSFSSVNYTTTSWKELFRIQKKGGDKSTAKKDDGLNVVSEWMNANTFLL